MKGVAAQLREKLKRRFRMSPRLPNHRIFRLTPEGKVRGRMLLSFSIFIYERLLRGKEININHPAAWTNFNISRVFLDMGLQVDVISFDNSMVVIGSNYDVVLDVCSNLERISGFVQPECLKLMYPMFGHWSVHNTNQYKRHTALLRRRGNAIVPSRIIPPTRSFETSDHIIHPGGKYSAMGFGHASACVNRVAQVHPYACSDFIKRDFEMCKRNFVWLGGAGAVHKGLDLVLEAFARLPECELFVCGDIAAEKEFENIYRHELYELQNIHTFGWVDMLSDEWRDIALQCGSILLHSASEVRATSLIGGMLSGLIPVANNASDHDLSQFGFIIDSDTVEAVADTVEIVRNTANQTLALMSRAAFDAAHEQYGQERFLDGFRSAVSRILALEPTEPWKPWDSDIRVPSICDVTHKFTLSG